MYILKINKRKLFILENAFYKLHCDARTFSFLSKILPLCCHSLYKTIGEGNLLSRKENIISQFKLALLSCSKPINHFF